MPVKQDHAKNWFWVILDAALVAVFVLSLVGAKAFYSYGKSVPPSRMVSVSAESKASLAPDTAVVNFSVIAEGADPQKLQADNTGKMNKAIDFVKAQGVDAKDIRTTGYNLSPKYEYNPKTGRNYINGYTFSQSVEVKVRDLNKVSAILAGLPGLGINNISGPRFTIEDPDKFLNQARAEAFAKARAKAEAMAGYAGARIGRVITFSESGGGGPIPYYALESGFGKGGGPVPAPTIEPGSQELTVQVSVTYELR